MYHFDSPWFALLLLLPLVVSLFPRTKVNPNDGSPEILFPAIHRVKKAFSSAQMLEVPSNLPFYILLSLAWLGLVLALMQPEKVDQFKQVKNEGYDLMLAVDLSGSMQALDFSTRTKSISRLDVTKEVVGKFVQKRQGDRVGLITFGEQAFLHVPLTLDTASVSKMLNDTVTGMAGNSTAIGDAIGLSVRTLRDRPAGSRVLILLTDGENNAGAIPPLEAAKLAKQYGIRIYTIGIGKNGAVPMPHQRGGTFMGQSPLNEKMLKEISTLTHGHYFRATDQKALESIYDEIDRLEKSESNESIFLIREPYYVYPLALAMLLLLALTLFQIFNRRGSSAATGS